MIAENHKSAHVYALHHKSLDSSQKFKLDYIEESRTCAVLLALNGILMVNIIQMVLFFYTLRHIIYTILYILTYFDFAGIRNRVDIFNYRYFNGRTL